MSALEVLIDELVGFKDDLRAARDVEEAARTVATEARLKVDAAVVVRQTAELMISGTEAAIESVRCRDDITEKVVEEMIEAAWRG